MSLLSRIVDSWQRYYAMSSSERYVTYLKEKGVVIGANVRFSQLDNITIDITRPSLIEIGDNVRFTRGFTLLTHDFSFFVLRNLYNEYISSSGRVKIGSNVFFGFHSTVLMNSSIGDNCIIGTGAIVTGDIPSNSVAAGVPAKVICSVEEYYNKRKKCHIEEAFDYARSIQERHHRKPKVADFHEEFPLFLNGTDDCDDIPIKKQLGPSYDKYKQQHKAVFHDFNTFLKTAGIKELEKE